MTGAKFALHEFFGELGQIKAANKPLNLKVFGDLNDNVADLRDKSIDIPFPNRNIINIRVAARFFSGVPHPHLLGVCCPNFLFPAATEIFPRKP